MVVNQRTFGEPQVNRTTSEDLILIAIPPLGVGRGVCMMANVCSAESICGVVLLGPVNELTVKEHDVTRFSNSRSLVTFVHADNLGLSPLGSRPYRQVEQRSNRLDRSWNLR